MSRKSRHKLHWIFKLMLIVGLIYSVEMVTAFVVTVSAARNGKKLAAENPM